MLFLGIKHRSQVVSRTCSYKSTKNVSIKISHLHGDCQVQLVWYLLQLFNLKNKITSKWTSLFILVDSKLVRKNKSIASFFKHYMWICFGLSSVYQVDCLLAITFDWNIEVKCQYSNIFFMNRVWFVFIYLCWWI